MELLFAGTPDIAVPALHQLVASEHQILGVITRPPAHKGRGRVVQESPVAVAAREIGLDVFTPQTAHERRTIVQAMAPDCCPVIAYGSLIETEALAIPKYGWVNVHFSLLPRWRGAAPVQWAILSGDNQTGMCTFQIEAGLDTGPIFDCEVYELHGDATTGGVLTDLGTRAGALLLRTLFAIEAGDVKPRTQPTEGITHAPKLTPGDAQIDWQEPAQIIDRRIRACSPEPGAWTMWKDQRVQIGPAVPNDETLTPGVIERFGDDVYIGCGNGALVLHEVQPAGKKMMRVSDWLRGVRGTVVFT